MLFKTVAVVYLYLFCVRGVICCQKFPKWILACRSYFFKSHSAFPSRPCPLMLDNHASRDCYCGDKRLLLPTPHYKALVTWACSYLSSWRAWTARVWPSSRLAALFLLSPPGGSPAGWALSCCRAEGARESKQLCFATNYITSEIFKNKC